MSLGVFDDGYDVNLPPVGGQFAAAASGTDPDNILDKDEKLRRMARAMAARLVAASTEEAVREVNRASSPSSVTAEFGRQVRVKPSGSNSDLAGRLLEVAEKHGLPDLEHLRRRLNVDATRYTPGRNVSGFDLN